MYGRTYGMHGRHYVPPFQSYMRSPEETKVRNTLLEAGVVTVKIRFSGGNDEGGADERILLDAKGRKIGNVNYDAVDFYALTPKRKSVRKEKVKSPYGGTYTRPLVARKIVEDEAYEIQSILDSPIDGEYGGFGGDFRVAGICTWDVKSWKYELKETERMEWREVY